MDWILRRTSLSAIWVVSWRVCWEREHEEQHGIGPGSILLVAVTPPSWSSSAHFRRFPGLRFENPLEH